MRRGLWAGTWPAGLALLVIACALEVLARGGIIPSYILPAPSEVFFAFGEFREAISTAFCSSLQNVLAGLGLAIVVSVTLAGIFSTQLFLRRALYPICSFFQTVPIVSIAPVLVIWFGFGAPTVRAASFIVCVFPLLASLMSGLENVRPDLLELFRSFHATSAQIFFRLRLPSAIPSFFSGLRIAAGLAVVGVIVGEFVAGSGLGNLIDSARTQQRVDLIFACILLASLLALILVFLIDFVHSRIDRNYPPYDQR